MNCKELVRKVASVMRENDIRKPVSFPKHVFHISDDEGNSKDFSVKKTNKDVLFTVEDIEAVINTFIYVIKESLKEGEPVSIRDFGTFGLSYHKPRRTKHPSTGEPVEIDAHYVPKFSYSKDLRMCAKVFELSLVDKLNALNLPPIGDEDGD